MSVTELEVDGDVFDVICEWEVVSGADLQSVSGTDVMLDVFKDGIFRLRTSCLLFSIVVVLVVKIIFLSPAIHLDRSLLLIDVAVVDFRNFLTRL